MLGFADNVKGLVQESEEVSLVDSSCRVWSTSAQRAENWRGHLGVFRAVCHLTETLPSYQILDKW